MLPMSSFDHSYFIYYIIYRFANVDGHLSTKINTASEGSGLNEYVQNLFDKSLTWDDIKWLKG